MEDITRQISLTLKVSDAQTALDPFIRDAQTAQAEVAKLKREMEQATAWSKSQASARATDPLTAQAAAFRASVEGRLSADIAAAAREAQAHQERMKAFDWGAANGLVVHSGMAGKDATLFGRFQAAMGSDKQFASPEVLAELDAFKKRAEEAKKGAEDLDKTTKSVTGTKAFADSIKKTIEPMSTLRTGLTALRENFGFFLGIGFAVVEGVEAIAKAFDSAGRATKRYTDTVGTVEEQRKALVGMGAESDNFRKQLGLLPGPNASRDRLREINGESREEAAQRMGIPLPPNPYAGKGGLLGEGFERFLERTLGGKEGVLGSGGQMEDARLRRAVHAQRLQDLAKQEAEAEWVAARAPYGSGDDNLKRIRGEIATARGGLSGADIDIARLNSDAQAAYMDLYVAPVFRQFGDELSRAPDMVQSAARSFAGALSMAGGAARAIASDFRFGFMKDPTLASLGMSQDDIVTTLAGRNGSRGLATQILGELRSKWQYTNSPTDKAEFQAALKRYDSVLTYGDRMSFKIDARGSKFQVNQRVETNNPAMLARASLRAGFEAAARYPIESMSRPGSVGLANGRRR